MQPIAKGIWPTMITPFTDDNRLDENAIPHLIDWYHQHGCDGVFAVCQSSEMFCLTLKERVRLARLCVQSAGERLQVVASGHIANTAEEQIQEIAAIWETGVRAVVLVSNRFALPEDSDDIWIQNAQRIVNALPGVPLGMYECPYPYKRLITPKTLTWMVQSGRFTFLKDTCCNAETIRQRLRIIRDLTADSQPRLRLYNANTMTLLESLRDGADGFCGVMGNLHPELYGWLYRHHLERTQAVQEMQAMLTLLSSLESQAYPICAKKHMQHESIPMTTVTRSIPEKAFQYANAEALRQAEIIEAAMRRIYIES